MPSLDNPKDRLIIPRSLDKMQRLIFSGYCFTLCWLITSIVIYMSLTDKALVIFCSLALAFFNGFMYVIFKFLRFDIRLDKNSQTISIGSCYWRGCLDTFKFFQKFSSVAAITVTTRKVTTGRNTPSTTYHYYVCAILKSKTIFRLDTPVADALSEKNDLAEQYANFIGCSFFPGKEKHELKLEKVGSNSVRVQMVNLETNEATQVDFNQNE